MTSPFAARSYAEFLRLCAEQLVGGMSAPIHVRALLRRFGVALEKRLGDPDIREGEVRRTSAGRYIVYIVRRDGQPAILTPRERFTLAHELGHILLDRRFGLRPGDHDEYTAVEHACNEFAASVLVPRSAIEPSAILDSVAAFELLRRTRLRCQVSTLVAGRQLANLRSDVAYFEGLITRNADGEQVVAVQWSAGMLPGFSASLRPYLSYDHPLSAALLERSHKWMVGYRIISEADGVGKFVAVKRIRAQGTTILAAAATAVGPLKRLEPLSAGAR